MTDQARKDQLLGTLRDLRTQMEAMGDLSDAEFDEAIGLWHESVEKLKDSVFDTGNRLSRIESELGWGAQSTQFVIDCLPDFHRVLLEHYKRKDELKLLDVGAGTGAGAQLFSLLHSHHYIYSKIQVDAIDNVPLRERWAKALYPRVRYAVKDLYDLPDREWDLIFCSHVIEHVLEPRAYCEHLVRVCKGFAFIYAPYEEKDRIPKHINVITKELFRGFPLESLKIVRSMGWHPAKPADHCILVVVDCRERQ